MIFARFTLLVLLAAASASPALAQTAQTTPGKPATPSITPTPGKPAAAPPASPAPARPSAAALIDINSATAAELDALPGVGKTRADAIIKNRPYNGKDDLLNKGIIPANVYKDIANKIIARQK